VTDLEQIRAEILRFTPVLTSEILPTDITLEMIMEVRECSYDSARHTARKMLDSGEYKKIYVKNENNHRTVVFRKVRDDRTNQ
jgi:hypothetical protein